MWFKKNLFNVILVALAALLIFYPPAKVWMLQQFMRTGLMNVSPEIIPGPTPAPMTFRSEEGVILTNKQLEGKVVFMNFWATWCPPCLAELPSMQTLYNRYRHDKRVVFLFVDADHSADRSNAFLQKKGLDLPVYAMASEPDKILYSGTLPTTVVLNKKGQVILHHAGIGRYDTQRIYDLLEAEIGR